MHALETQVDERQRAEQTADEPYKRFSPSSVPVRQPAIRHTDVQLVSKGTAVSQVINKEFIDAHHA